MPNFIELIAAMGLSILIGLALNFAWTRALHRHGQPTDPADILFWATIWPIMLFLWGLGLALGPEEPQGDRR